MLQTALLKPAGADRPLQEREPPPEHGVGGEGEHAEGVADFELEDAGDELGDAAIGEGEGHDDGDGLVGQDAGVDCAEDHGGKAESGEAERAGIGKSREDRDWRRGLRVDGVWHR